MYNIELSLKVKRVMLMFMMFSIDLVQYETKHLKFKNVFYNLHEPIWMALRKRGVTF